MNELRSSATSSRLQEGGLIRTGRCKEIGCKDDRRAIEKGEIDVGVSSPYRPGLLGKIDTGGRGGEERGEAKGFQKPWKREE